jgi:hypothetical protein
LRDGEFFEDFVEGSQQTVRMLCGAERETNAAFAGVIVRAITDEDAAPAHLLHEGL